MNQLFSLEEGIYFAERLQKKLKLIIRHPLVHCGVSQRSEGKTLLDFLAPLDAEIVTTVPPDSYILPINNRLSRIAIVDSSLNTPENQNQIRRFAACREIHTIDWNALASHEHIFINQSNASRMFYNFFTTGNEYERMKQIASRCRKLKPEIESRCWNIIKLPAEFQAVHFRFGDTKHTKETIDKEFASTSKHLFSLLKPDMPVLVMCDRRDAEVLSKIPNIMYSDDFMDSEQAQIDDFLIQMQMCVAADYFIGTCGSTVSHYINYCRFMDGKNCDAYHNIPNADGLAVFSESPAAGFDWEHSENCSNGPAVSWRMFWKTNVIA